MIQLNFMDLNEEAKERLFQRAKQDVERQFGNNIGQHAKRGLVNYEDTITAEAQRRLYDYTYVFGI